MSADDLRVKAGRLRSQIPERRQAKPPEENGRRLATVSRGPDEELRVNWSFYENKPFLSLRIWTRDDHGQWWPDGKRGVAIRIRELPDIAEAIAESLDLAAEHQRGRQPAQRARGGAEAPSADRLHQRSQECSGGAHSGSRTWHQPELPDARPGAAGEFDEFSGSRG
jgi:hypothetical protein